jgi:hypothetical protein
MAIFTAAVAFAIALQDILPNRYLALGTSATYFLSGFVGSGLGPTLVAIATDQLYRDSAAVGKSLVTVVLPATLVAIAAFVMGTRALRAGSTSRLGVASAADVR